MKETGLIDFYEEKKSNIRSNEKEINQVLLLMQREFVNYYSDNRVCKDRFVFKEKHYEKLAKAIFGLDSSELKLEIKKRISKPEWKNVSSSRNITLLFLLKYYSEKRNNFMQLVSSKVLAYNFASGLLLKYFKHGCQELVMDFTINNLSGHYLLTKFDGSFIKVIDYLAENNIKNYEGRSLIASKNDGDFVYFIITLRTALNSLIQNTAKAYYINFNSKLYLSKNQTVTNEEGGDISEFENNTSSFISFKNKVMTYINRTSIDTYLLKKINKVTGVKVSVLEDMFIDILKEEDRNEELLRAIFDSYKSINKTLICSQSFISSNVKFLTSKYDDNKLKSELDGILHRGLGFGYKKMSDNSKRKYKRALVLLYTIYLQKANCG